MNKPLKTEDVNQAIQQAFGNHSVFDLDSDSPFMQVDQDMQELQLTRKLSVRSRWEGVLSKEEIELCNRCNISLAYDCGQQGWVVYNEQEEFEQKDTILFGDSVKENAKSIRKDMNINDVVVQFEKELEHLSVKDVKTSDFIGLINRAMLSSVAANNIFDGNHLHCRFVCSLAKRIGRGQSPSNGHKLECHNFNYRKWTLADLEDFKRILGNEKVWLNLPEEFPQRFDDELASSLIELANLDNHSSNFAVEYNGGIVGQVRILKDRYHKDLNAAEIVYMLDENFWGKGLMSNILSDFINKQFAKDKYAFIYAWIKPGNLASIKCAENADFIRDYFKGEEGLANTCNREGFVRYVRVNTQYNFNNDENRTIPSYDKRDNRNEFREKSVLA